MNIFWIITDGICNYERSDLYGLLPTYKKLKRENEGFYFENALSLFPSTSLSVFSMILGRFPYYIFPDYYRSIENLPSYKYQNMIYSLKKSNYKIQSIMLSREMSLTFKEILNPFYMKNMYRGDKLLNPKDLYNIFIQKVDNIVRDENNFFYIHFRPGSMQTDYYLNQVINYLKQKDFWENSIIIINSDHGFYDKNIYKKTKLIHFDDIRQTSLQSALFIKLPDNITNSSSKVIERRVYLIDIMETILDYLKIKASHERESISFKQLIERDINVNKSRIIRADCYLMFQPIKKTAIIKDYWKLLINNGKFSLHNLKEDKMEIKDLKEKFPKIYSELYRFYLKTESKAYNSLKSTLDNFYNKSIFSSLESQNILIPKQFPPQLTRYLKQKLKLNNYVENSSNTKRHNLIKKRNVLTILIFNRLTGYGIKKLKRKYKRITKEFIILDTKLFNAVNQMKNIGYLNFVFKSLIHRRKQFIQRWKEILTWVFYFPIYFNKCLKNYYD
ncbi:MAG: sulfatase-like hydrolase/transferase [Promethearchaeota archaeon]